VPHIYGLEKKEGGTKLDHALGIPRRLIQIDYDGIERVKWRRLHVGCTIKPFVLAGATEAYPTSEDALLLYDEPGDPRVNGVGGQNEGKR